MGYLDYLLTLVVGNHGDYRADGLRSARAAGEHSAAPGHEIALHHPAR